MVQELVQSDRSGGVRLVTLCRSEQHNALTQTMMEQLLGAIESASQDDDAMVVRLRGSGPSFCSGFDLAAAVDQPGLMSRFIESLGRITLALRRLPQVVVAEVQGSALAGGCAIVSACDFVVAEPGARFGYPVHRIGVSPAVSLPTLRQRIGDGSARALLMSGRVIDAAEAHRIGLVTHLAASASSLPGAAQDLCRLITSKGRIALRATKRWIGELDGSLDDAAFEAATTGSAADADGPEARELLRAFWQQRRATR